MTEPAEYIEEPVVVEVCTPGDVQQIPVPPVLGQVECPVPKFKEICEPGVETAQCVPEQVQVCEPYLEWRKEQFCNYDDKGGFIRKVQQALVQDGFDPGPIDGLLNDTTRQAIRDFQAAKGLAQGGSLTQETVQALGVTQ